MKRISVRVPVRADLAGGTLDLWPLYLFHPGARTVNVAISFHAECEVTALEGTAVEILFTDHNYERRYETLAELSEDPQAVLVARALEHFDLSGLRIVTKTDAPRGSGLGGSSALSIALVRAFSELAGTPLEGDDLIYLVRDLETRLIGSPAGVQDYYPPVYGGLASLHLQPGGIVRTPLSLSTDELSRHMVLHYSGVSHFSGTNNWEIYKRQIDGDLEVRAGLSRIAAIANRMEEALARHDLAKAGSALGEEWIVRKALIEGISNPEIDQAIEAAASAGAWGGKVCGAGGGGCIVFMMPAEKRQSVIDALAKVPGETLNASPVAYGLVIEPGEAVHQPSRSVGRSSRTKDSHESLDQLYLVTKESGAYRPYLLSEGAITYEQPRSGSRITITRAYLAPVELNNKKVNWQKAIVVDPDRVQFSAVPEPARGLPAAFSPARLGSATADAEESFREFLQESEDLLIYHNAHFGLYSSPNEGRESFIERCMSEGTKGLDSETERLESTFRRRMDQMQQRSDREQRELHSQDESARAIRPQEVDIAWGQALYNITSGKPQKSEPPRTVAEADYVEKISRLQKQWERELDAIRDEVKENARAVEEVLLSPSPRNINVVRSVVVWAPSLKELRTESKTKKRSSKG